VSPFRLSRRALLRGAGGIAIGLPFLEIMSKAGSARAATPPIPQRLVVFFSPNGYIRPNWSPTGTETDFTLARTMAKLAPYQKKLIVLDGVDNEAAKHGVGDDHMRGMGTMLTGIELLSGTTQGGCCEPAGLAGGPSVDQKIAQAIGKDNKFKSVEFGVQAGSSGTVWGYTSYAASNQPLPPENNPGAIFTRIFGQVGGDQTALAKLQAERKSVLDAVAGSYSSLSPKLGATDKDKIDLHLSQIRDLETRLTATGAIGASCVKPGPPTGDYKQNDSFPKVGKLQMDLLTMALACDLTRVTSLQWENSVGGARFSWLGMDRGHHDMSHDGDDVTATKEKLTQIDTWYMDQLLYLMDGMAKIPEGDAGGTLLDHTLILCCNELSRGNAHSHPDMPFLLAGGTDAAPKPLKMGRYLKYADGPSVKHNDLLVSLLNVFGLPDKTFGNPAYCSGPLARL
jgi:hypothetical protein